MPIEEAKMSLTFEIADWRFELTWDGIGCLPVERSSLESTTGLALAARAENRSHRQEMNEEKYIREEKAIYYELN
jgi:hypothetical protein